MTILDPEALAAAGLALELDGVVLTVTLDKPARRNSQTPRMWHALAAVGERLPADVRVVVLRGAGDCFSAGIDTRLLGPEGVEGEESVLELMSAGDRQVLEAIDGYQRGFTWLADPRIVSIAAVHGYAIGAGFQLALAADLRVASLDAWFAMRETSLGLVPDLGGTGPLVHLVGYARALEICATGRRVSAPEAHAMGLVNAIAPAADLDEATFSLVQHVLTAPDAAVRALKPLLRSAVVSDRDTQLAAEREAQGGLLRALLGGAES